MTNNQEREARYAAAIGAVYPFASGVSRDRVRAVVAVADAEQAELRAACIPITDLVQELNLARQNLRRTEGELAALREQMETMRAGAHEVGRISMAAVAREKALRGRIEALAAELEDFAVNGEVSSGIAMGWREGVRIAAHNVRRAALAASPAEDTTPAAPHAEDGALVALSRKGWHAPAADPSGDTEGGQA